MPDEQNTNGQQQNDPQGQQQGQQNTQQSETPATWDAVVATLPAPAKALYEAHTQGLRKALDSERETNKTHEKTIRDLSKGVEKGSEAEKQLTSLADQYALANRRADFFQEVAKPETGLADPEAAWIIANAKPDEFFDRKGNLNVELLKQRHPGLFAKPVQQQTPKGNAGNGAGQQGAGAETFNISQLIRSAAPKR